MHLPNAESAIIPFAKVVDYLLSATHPDGQHKAAFFRSFGFDRDRIDELISALRRHARENPVVAVRETGFGLSYTVDGGLTAPDGRRPQMRTVWFMVPGGPAPRLVTAHPLSRSQR